MSTMEATPDYADQAKMPRKVMMNFDLSGEALNRVLDRNPKVPGEMLGQIQVLIAGFMTLCEKLRDAQLAIEQYDATGHKIELDVPTLRRLDDLKEAGRAAQLAITNAQTAMMYARRAAELVHAS